MGGRILPPSFSRYALSIDHFHYIKSKIPIDFPGVSKLIEGSGSFSNFAPSAGGIARASRNNILYNFLPMVPGNWIHFFSIELITYKLTAEVKVTPYFREKGAHK